MATGSRTSARSPRATARGPTVGSSCSIRGSHDYIEGDLTIVGRGAAPQGWQLMTSCRRTSHEGHWQVMDTLKDKMDLQDSLGQRCAPLGDMGIDAGLLGAASASSSRVTPASRGRGSRCACCNSAPRCTALRLVPPTDPSLYDLAGLAADVPQAAIDIRDYGPRGWSGARCASRTSSSTWPHSLIVRRIVQLSSTGDLRGQRDGHRQSSSTPCAWHGAVGAARCINVTSDKCYENREWEWGYREDEPMGGYDPYSNSKGCSELVTSAYRQSFFGDADTARVASVRAGNVIGGGDWAADRLIPDIMRATLAGEVVPIRRPGAIRPWQHVLNPLSGYLEVAQRAVRATHRWPPAFNFGPDDADTPTRCPRGWFSRLTALLARRRSTGEIEPGPHPHEATYLKLDSSRGQDAPWVDRQIGASTEGLDAIVEWYLALRDGASVRDTTRRPDPALLEHLRQSTPE